MKTFSKILTAITATALLAAGCVNEDPAYKKTDEGGGTTPSTDNTGFLAVGELSMRVAYDLQPDDTSDETQRPSATAGAVRMDSRASTEEDAYIVEIFDAANSSVEKTTYGELKQRTEPIKLTVGNYTLQVSSEQEIPAAEWDHPVYGTTRPFSIRKGQTETLDEVVCTLKNIKVTLECSADLVAQLDTSVTSALISLGDAQKIFSLTETRAAYFRADEATTLDFLLEGAFIQGEGDDESTVSKVKFSKQIENVKAGQWRKITLVIAHADKGEVKFDIQVDSFMQDEEVVVNGTANLWEAIFVEEPTIDPSAPTISWPEHDLSQPFTLLASMFDEDHKCTVPCLFDLSSPNGIESFKVDISSTNDAFMASLKEVLSLSEPSFDLCTVQDNLAIMLSGFFGTTVGEPLKGEKRATLEITNQMYMLYQFPGTHTFAFTLKDANGLTQEAQLTIVVSSGSPKIEWPEHDLSQRYTIDEALIAEAINLSISSPTGINSLVVTITSTNANFVASFTEILGLSSNSFDLCDLTDDLAQTLGGFGFPVMDAVKGKTEVPFTIQSRLLELLGAAEFSGEHNFQLSVTDANGTSTEAAIMLLNPNTL